MSDIAGGAGADRLLGSVSADNISGGSADDTLVGSSGNDVLSGGAGNDFLNGNRDNDTLFGQAGNDTLRGGKDDDHLHGGDITITSDDNDLLYGDLGNDVLLGNRNNDILYGGEGNDSLRGGKNEDALNGLEGNDTLNGDLGNDTLTGNEGIDRFAVGADAGSTDIINDLHGDGIEQVDLTAFTAITSFDQLSITDVGTDAHIALGNSQTLILKNQTSTSLTAADFIFSSSSSGGGGGGSGGAGNVRPTVTGWDATPSYTQSASAVVVDNNVVITDTDSTNLTGVTVQITNDQDGANEVLAATDSGGVTSSYTAGTHTLTLTGAATVAAYQTVLRTVTYIDNAGSVTAGSRTLQVIASDGLASSITASTTLTVIANTPPVVSGWNATPTYTEGNAALTVDNDVTITDAQGGNLSSVTIQITNDQDGANEVLAATDSGGVTSSYNAGSHTLTLSGAASIAAYQTVLRTVTYINNSQDPTAGARTLEVIANDGMAASTAVNTTVTVAAVNDPPVNTVPLATQTTNVDTNLVISGVSIADVDDTSMDTVTLTVTNGTLTVSTAVGGGVTGGQVTNNGTASVTIAGATVTALNNTFADAAGLTFAPTGSYTGPASFTIASDDGDDTDTDVVNISVIGADFLLANLDGTDGFRLTGTDINDSSGVVVSHAGDINGDGFEDFLIGTNDGEQAVNDQGESYVVFGKSTAFASNINLSVLDGTDGFRLTGIDASDYAGRAVEAAGDINSDGFDDIFIGAPSAEPEVGGANDDGEGYIVFGKGTAFASSIALGSLDGTDGFRLTAIADGDDLGRQGGVAGDINGDGFDDILVGAWGVGAGSDGDAYLIYGKSNGFTSNINISALDATDGFTINAEGSNGDFGRAVDALGDINNDGYDDFIIGARDLANGASYVIYGKGTSFGTTVEASALDGTDGFQLSGITAADRAGMTVSSAGDINGDGFDDIMIGAYRAEPTGGGGEGETYIIFGKSGAFASDLSLTTLDGTDGFRLTGIDANDYSGHFVNNAGDVNGDGFDDIIVGARHAETAAGGGNNTGESYLVFGKSSGWAADTILSVLDGTDGFRLTGIDNGDESGYAVDAAGDINGDGFNDIIVGAFGAENGNNLQGETYVIYGRDFNGVVTHNGTSGADNITGSAGADAIVAGLGNDTIDGGAGADDIAAAGGNDIIIYGAGDTKIRGDRGSDTLRFTSGDDIDFTAIANNRITSIESLDGLTDTGANTITMTYLDMLSISEDTNTLTIDGQSGDTLAFTQQSGVTFSFSNDGTYNIFDFNDGGFTLKVDQDIALTGLSQQEMLLANLDGADGFRLTGITAADELGRSVSSAGDLNGDGFDDIIVAAKDADNGIPVNAGEAYVVFGKSTSFASNINVSALDGADGFRISGTDTYDNMGFVTGVGDINGDGFDDLLAAAIFAEPSANSPDDRDGEDYIIFGKGTAFASNIFVSALDGNDGFRLSGVSNNDQVGASVSGAGDINGDGLDDFIMGARYAEFSGATNTEGEAYVVFGKTTSFGSNIELSALDGTDGFRLEGNSNNDYAGFSVSVTGDINGDGYNDIIVGAVNADDGSTPSNAGETYVVFGKGTSYASLINLEDLDGSDGFALGGLTASDNSGFFVSSIGDINGDGFDDLITGAREAEPSGGNSEGEAYVLFGKGTAFAAALSVADLDGTDGFRLTGIDASDETGYSVSGAGDVNGDGFDDFIIGARYAERAAGGGDNHGASYLIFGKGTAFASNINLSVLDGTDGFVLSGVSAGDRTGQSVSNAGDIDGDGYDDIIIGAKDAEPTGGNDEGESYVIYGRDYTFAATQIGTSGNDTLTGTAGADKIDGVAGNDSMTGAGGVDTLIGGAGDDTLDGGTGADVLIGGNGNDTFVYESSDTVIRGGRGTDVLTLTSISTADLSAVNSFKSIETITSDNTALTLTMPTLDSVTITTGTGADTITLGNGRQTINSGAGADTINSGGGSDTINLGTSDTAADRVRYDDANDGAVEEGFNTGHDSITQFEVGTDQIQLGGVFNGGATDLDDVTADDNITFASDAAANFTTTHEALLRTGLADADLTEASFATIVTNLNTLGITAAATETAFIVIQAATQTGFYLYIEDGGAANDISAGEMTLLGVSNGQLTTADFDFY